MRRVGPRALLWVASALTLAALGLMVWSLFDPRPIPVIAAMSLGQVLGTLSLGIFGYVVVADVRARTAAGPRRPPPGQPEEERTSPESL